MSSLEPFIARAHRLFPAGLLCEDITTPADHAWFIVRAVAHSHRVSVADIRSASRSTNIVRARHEACHRLRMELGLSYGFIATYVNRRDHKTIINAVKRHAARIA